MIQGLGVGYQAFHFEIIDSNSIHVDSDQKLLASEAFQWPL